MKPLPKPLAMEGPTGAVQKQMAPRVRYPTTLTKGGREMAKFVEEHTRGEVSCQELADRAAMKREGMASIQPKSVWIMTSSVGSKIVPLMLRSCDRT